MGGHKTHKPIKLQLPAFLSKVRVAGGQKVSLPPPILSHSIWHWAWRDARWDSLHQLSIVHGCYCIYRILARGPTAASVSLRLCVSHVRTDDRVSVELHFSICTGVDVPFKTCLTLQLFPPMICSHFWQVWTVSVEQLCNWHRLLFFHMIQPQVLHSLSRPRASGVEFHNNESKSVLRNCTEWLCAAGYVGRPLPRSAHVFSTLSFFSHYFMEQAVTSATLRYTCSRTVVASMPTPHPPPAVLLAWAVFRQYLGNDIE